MLCTLSPAIVSGSDGVKRSMCTLPDTIFVHKYTKWLSNGVFFFLVVFLGYKIIIIGRCSTCGAQVYLPLSSILLVRCR